MLPTGSATAAVGAVAAGRLSTSRAAGTRGAALKLVLRLQELPTIYLSLLWKT